MGEIEVRITKALVDRLWDILAAREEEGGGGVVSARYYDGGYTPL